MAYVRVVTDIAAPIEVVFDLARSLRFHELSTTWTRERVISKHDRDLLDKGDVVTFEAVHLGVRQRLTAKVFLLTYPSHFQDVMLEGAFARLVHDHRFDKRDDGTRMTDELLFEAPYGVLGRIVGSLFLTGYMRRFLERRGKALKAAAEAIR